MLPLPAPRSRATSVVLVVASLAVVGSAAFALTDRDREPTEAVEGDADGATDGDQAIDRPTDDATSRLVAEVGGIRGELGPPAFAARDDAATLRLLLAESVIGTDRDADRVVEQVTEVGARLEDAADRLESQDIAEVPAPTSPAAEPPSEVPDPQPTSADALREQAADVAVRLREATEGTVEISAAALELQGAAERFAGAEPPDSTDPDALAAAWADDRDRLGAYHDAAGAAAELPALERHAAAHLEVATSLIALADDAVERLQAGDLDAYDMLLDERLPAAQTLLDGLEPNLAHSLDAVVSAIETAEGRVLGLLGELDRLRAATPVR
jgi:hypothetical protein